MKAEPDQPGRDRQPTGGAQRDLDPAGARRDDGRDREDHEQAAAEKRRVLRAMDEAATVMAGPGIRQHEQSEKCDEQCDPLKGIEADKAGIRHRYDLRASSSAAERVTRDRGKGSVRPDNLR